MRRTTPSFHDDADAARHLLHHLRRMLLVYYDPETVFEHTITEKHVADAFAHHERFRRHLALQGINPDTHVACTDEGRTMVGAIINGWVRALRMPLDASERYTLRNPGRCKRGARTIVPHGGAEERGALARGEREMPAKGILEISYFMHTATGYKGSVAIARRRALRLRGASCARLDAGYIRDVCVLSRCRGSL
jgi:hypothetical protein